MQQLNIESSLKCNEQYFFFFLHSSLTDKCLLFNIINNFPLNREEGKRLMHSAVFRIKFNIQFILHLN